MRVHTRQSTTVILHGDDEQFVWTDRNANQFRADHVFYGAGDEKVSLRGTGIKKDGTAALINREGSALLKDLPVHVLVALVQMESKDDL